MAWFDEAVFYHIYPLGLLGAPKINEYAAPVHRLRALAPWIEHLASLGVTALYIGPLFQSVGHGYETTDYRTVDARLGDNDDLVWLVQTCHSRGIRVVLDAVFNHTGRDFFAFRDLKEKRETSPYRDWYRGVNLWGDNSYHDGFSYETWGGYDLLPKLNLQNPAVRQYHLDTVRYWVEAFDIDGLRLDAADVLDFAMLRELKALSDTVKPDFWLMGEVIHGEYARWLDAGLHSVTDYPLHKALFSGHNDRNYFEIAHTLNRFYQSGVDPRRLYTFTDNHDVDRLISKLNRRAAWLPVQILAFTLPGIPSVYYGSEFAIEGKKTRSSDDPVRPALELSALQAGDPFYPDTIRALAQLRRSESALVYGDYRQVQLSTEQYAFLRGDILISVNCASSPAALRLPCESGVYRGVLHGKTATAQAGALCIELDPDDGEIWIPAARVKANFAPIAVPKSPVREAAPVPQSAAAPLPPVPDKPYEQMSVPELQSAVLAKLAHNGPITDRMRREVAENVYRDSLLNWVKSFR